MDGFLMGSIKKGQSEKIQKALQYNFIRPSLLEEALTHPSAMNHHKGDAVAYERLEFLGDRVLGLVIAEMLLKRNPNEAEGDIAKRHTALVRGETLTIIAENIGLGESLLLSSGEHKTGGRYKAAVLADAMEALIGAIYLDGGLEAAQELILREWNDIANSIETPPQDPKTILQEWVQEKSLPLPKYELVSKTGFEHEPVFEMRVSVEGFKDVMASSTSKRRAEKKAAEQMLKNIEEENDR